MGWNLYGPQNELVDQLKPKWVRKIGSKPSFFMDWNFWIIEDPFATLRTCIHGIGELGLDTYGTRQAWPRYDFKVRLDLDIALAGPGPTHQQP